VPCNDAIYSQTISSHQPVIT